MATAAGGHDGVSRKRILFDSALATTFHGLRRTVGDRSYPVRLLWLLAFLSLVGLLSWKFVVALQKLQSVPVTTAIETNAEPFVFPDMHFCSFPLVSASYPVEMGAEAWNSSQVEVARIAQLLSRVNESSLYLVSQAFMSTVPYHFLSQNFGMRKEQSIIKATVVPTNLELKLDVDIVDLRHFKHLNCFTVRPQNSTITRLLGSVLAYLDIVLYTDASYSRQARLYNGKVDVRGLSFVYYEALIGSGFRVYFTPRGVYPDDYSPSVTVSPGYTSNIELSMEVSQLASQRGLCINDSPDVQYVDQGTGMPINYKYNLPACYAATLTDLFAKNSGSYLPGLVPMPYANRDLPSAFNFSKLNANSSVPEIQETVTLMKKLNDGTMTNESVWFMRQMQAHCQTRMPCSGTIYTPRLSSIRSPLKQTVKSELSALLMSVNLSGRNYSTPGHDWLKQLFRRAMQSNATAADDAELLHAVSENILRVRVRAGEVTSTRVDQSVSYQFFDLTVEVGGLMSLFVGGSLLTLLEVVELCVSLLWGRKLEVATTDQDNAAAADSRSQILVMTSFVSE